ncbi:MAG: ATP-binding protein [Bacillota bacterium]|nr:ATP-binding protein [Bacillota bacterium]
MRTLILLSGLPGSGKSTWAKRFCHEYPKAKVVSSDAIRLREFGAVQNFDHEKDVWRIFLEEINGYAESDPDAVVIADSTNLSNYYRKYYFEATPNFEKHMLVYFDIPFEICQAQNKLRPSNRVVSDEAMKRLSGELEKPSSEIMSLFDEYIPVGIEFAKKGLAY